MTVFTRPPPYVHDLLPGEPGPVSAYFGVSIDASVNLVAAAEYGTLSQPEKLRTALAEQERLLEVLLGFAGRAAIDLRLSVRPERSTPLDVSILGRAWASDAAGAMKAAHEVKTQLLDWMPGHVYASPIDESAEVEWRLNPYGNQRLHAAQITKEELIDAPSRSDAGRSWYFSLVPFHAADLDWTPFYGMLARSPTPLTVSVGLFPVVVPSWLRQLFADWTTYYSRLAREAEQPAGLYYGRRRALPDPFAIEAQKVFADYFRRCSQRAYVMRIQVAGPHLTRDVVEALGSVISPPSISTSDPIRSRPVTGYDVRWLTEDRGHQIAQWNLAALDCYPAPGRPEIWARPDRLLPHFEVLSVLGDSKEARNAFRLPVAVNGSVPGIAVRRSPSAGTQPKARADVVILTATPVESDALERVMAAAGHDRQRLAYGPVNTYSLYGPIGETVVAHVRCTMGSGGTAAAGLTVRDAIVDLQPWAVLAVGIAFGIKDAEQPIGQLLLSESLSAYELQRIGDSSAGQVVISRGSTMSGSPTLLGRFRDSHLNELGIDVLAGEILSGEKLIDNAAFKAALVERYPNAVGGEMEGAGVVAASHRAAVEWLVVKAVCDYAHSKGDDKQSRQRLAADTAARALLEVLTKGALMRR